MNDKQNMIGYWKTKEDEKVLNAYNEKTRLEAYQTERKKIHSILKKLKSKTTGRKIKDIQWDTIESITRARRELEEIAKFLDNF